MMQKFLLFFLFGYLIVSKVTAQEPLVAIFANEFEQNVATRVTQFQIADPHLFATIGFLCADITAQVNDLIENQILEDGNDDGSLDLNLVSQFTSDQPQDIVNRALRLSLLDATCAAPANSEACEVTAILQENLATSSSQTGTCLQPIVGTTSGYVPAPNASAPPCYASEPSSSEIDLGGLTITLQGYQQAAQYTGGLLLDNGLRMGFISEADAEKAVFPVDTPVVGGSTLASLLPGGTDSCATGDDRDLFTDGTTSGWWFYFSTNAELIELSQGTN